MGWRSTALAIVVTALLGGVAWIAFTRGPGDDGLARDEREPPPTESPGRPALVAAEGPTTSAPAVGSEPATAGGAPPAQAPEADGAFLGIVVDEADRPIAGATVRVVSGWGAGRGIDPAGYPPATTGPDGRFRFAARGDVSTLYVTARAAGRAPARAGEALARGTEKRIVLVPTAPIRVTVAEKGSGAPVGEASVRAFAGSDPGSGAASDEAVTDARGRATLATPGGRASVLVLPRDHAPAARHGLFVGVEGLDVTIAVDPGGRIEGRVVDPAGRPVAGAWVLALSSPGRESRTTTDAEGSFVLAHVSLAETILAARAAGHPRAHVACPASTGATRTVEIALRPWAALTGFVRRESGDAVPGATVRTAEPWEPLEPRIEELASDPEMEAPTDAGGAFVLRRFPPEGGMVHATEPGRMFPRSGAVVVPEARVGEPVVIVLGASVPSGAAAREEQVVRLPGGVIAGLVTRTDGSPARVRVRLAIRSDGGETFLGGGDGTPTDEGGAFRFVGVGEGAYFLDVTSQGLSVVQGPGAARAGDTDLRLVVATWAEAVSLQLEVEAVDADTGRAPELPLLAVEVRRSGTSDVVRTAALSGDGTGLYRDEKPLVPGTYDVRVRADGYRDAEVAGVRVTAGGAVPRVRVSLEPAKRIEGSILDESGRPVPGPVEVGFGDRRVPVRPDGTYSFGVVHEPVLLHVAGDYVAQWARRPPPADAPAGAYDRIDFVVKTGGALRVRSRDGHVPVKAVVLRASTVDLATGEATAQREDTIDREWIDAHGASRMLPGLEPGRWRIEPVWDGVALPPRDVEIRDRETITLDVGP